MVLKNDKSQRTLIVHYSRIFLFFFLFTILFILPVYKNIGALILLILTVFTFVKYKRIRISSVFYIVSFSYILMLLYSFGNPVLHIEFKQHMSFFLVFIFLYQIIKEKDHNYELFFKLSFVFSIFVFILYLLFYLNLLPNIYRNEVVSSYVEFRVAGPPLDIFLFLPFIYAMKYFPKEKFQTHLYIGFILGLVACALSGSNQNFILLVLFYSCAILRLSVKNAIAIILIPIISILLAPKILSESHLDKISQIANPLDSETVLTRINDLSYAYDQMIKKDENIFTGEGIGIRTEVKRTSFDGKFSEYREFLEIDNGFFYVFHRLGIVGLIAYIATIFYLLYSFGTIRNKLMYLSFFLVTNLLSVHFFTHVYSAVFTYFLIRKTN